jgi:hypothetical protein
MPPTPFTVTTSLQMPVDSGQSSTTITKTVNGQFSGKEIGEFPLQGSGTFSVPLAMMGPAGLKVLLIAVDPSTDPTATPVVVKVNGQAQGIEISPGGDIKVASPNPQKGIHAIDIDYTSSNTVKAWALG